MTKNINISSWNYRVVTFKRRYKLGSKTLKVRHFTFTEVYYEDAIEGDDSEFVYIDKGKKPVSYVEVNNDDFDIKFESLEDLKLAAQRLLEATNKPIIDLDNFPKTYIEGAENDVDEEEEEE